MNTSRPMAATEMRAVTISREYGSGGGEIANRLARHLGWRLVDHEVVVRVAQELGVTEEEAASYDEQADSILTRILTSMRGVDPGYLVITPPPLQYTMQDYHRAVQKVVQTVVAAGKVVIVGRGAQVILASRRDVLHARIVAPLDMRIAYVMSREGLDESKARSRIHSREHERARYLQDEYNQHPDDPHLYDLTVNTVVIDLDSAVDLISEALTLKARRLSTPAEQIGPVAGLLRYPDQPGDLIPPEQSAK